jgi:hypothetical protein
MIVSIRAGLKTVARQGPDAALLLGAALCGWLLFAANPSVEPVAGPVEGPAASAGGTTTVVDIRYRNGQNTAFYLEPERAVYYESERNYLEGDLFVNGARVPGPADRGGRMRVYDVRDWSSYLREGHNQVVFVAYSSAGIVAFPRPALLGQHPASSLACLGLLSVLGMAVFRVTGRLGWPPYAGLLLGAGACYLTLWLHGRPNTAYTNDLPGHIDYILYLASHANPYEYRGGESFHPPLYYFLSSLVYRLFPPTGVINGLTAVRLLSLLFYLAFLFLGVRTLVEAVGTASTGSRVGLLLFAFWPVGILMATRVNNDLLLYALWAAAFHSLARWHQRHTDGDLAAALYLTGVALMVKSSAVVLAGVLGTCLLHGFLTGVVSCRDLGRGRLAWAWLFLVAALLVNIAKPIYLLAQYGEDTTGRYFGDAGQAGFDGWHFLRFDPDVFLDSPFAIRDGTSFLDYFLKSMLYGWSTWRHPDLASLLNGLLLVFLLVTLATLVGLRRELLRGLFPYIAGVVVPVTAVVLFTAYKDMAACQDFRFVLPLLTPLLVLFVRGLEQAANRPWGLLIYGLGIMAGVGLPLAAVAFYVGQYLG